MSEFPLGRGPSAAPHNVRGRAVLAAVMFAFFASFVPALAAGFVALTRDSCDASAVDCDLGPVYGLLWFAGTYVVSFVVIAAVLGWRASRAPKA